MLLNLNIFRIAMFSSLFKWLGCFKTKEQIKNNVMFMGECYKILTGGAVKGLGKSLLGGHRPSCLPEETLCSPCLEASTSSQPVQMIWD